MSFGCHLHVLVFYLYVLVCHSHVLVCTRMSSVCHSYVLVYVIRVSFVCARMSSVCHSCVLICHPYVTRMYSYVILMSLVCTRMYSYAMCMSILCYSYVTRMWMIHTLYVNHEPLYFPCYTFFWYNKVPLTESNLFFFIQMCLFYLSIV